MRFFLKSPPNPQSGDIRTVTKFLVFPMVIKGEFRWMERVTFRQEYHPSNWGGGSYWENLDFVDPKPAANPEF